MRNTYAERDQSSIIQLRKFHNWTKRELLSQTCDTINTEQDNAKLSLLDLSCGKGQDLQKWYGNNIMNVVGLDIDEASIIEAKKRYNEMCNTLKRQRKPIPRYEFYVMDLSNPNNISKIAKLLGQRKFTIVSCQFAIHYFFRNKESLDTLLTIVSSYITPDGYFIGTTLNGDTLIDKLLNTNILQNGIYKIEKLYNSITTPYNNTYKVSLGKSSDTDHYFADKDSVEYIVTIAELKKMCVAYGLTYVGIIEFATWYDSFKQDIMSNDEKEYSFLNFSFVFKNIVL